MGYKLIENKHCFSTSDILSILNVSKQTLSNWENDGCPKIAKGFWCIADVLRWRGMVGNGSIKTMEDVAEKSLAEQKLFYEVKLKSEQAETQELKNKISNGDYIDRDIVVQELSRNFEILKRTLNTLVSQISLETGSYVDILTARKIDESLKEVVRDYLTQMSEGFDYEPTVKRKKKRK